VAATLAAVNPLAGTTPYGMGLWPHQHAVRQIQRGWGHQLLIIEINGGALVRWHARTDEEWAQVQRVIMSHQRLHSNLTFDTHDFPAWAEPHLPPVIDAVNGPIMQWHVHGAGWPLIALSGGRSWGPSTAHATHRLIALSLPQPGSNAPAIVIPYRPIWPNVLINTVIFGAAILFPWQGFAAARADVRRRRGCCPGCGYDLAATARETPCPECGRVTLNRGAGTAI